MIQDNSDLAETHVPVPRQGGYQGLELNTEDFVQPTHERPLGPPTTSQKISKTGPIVLQLSYSVSCCAFHPQILGANNHCLVIWRFTLVDSG